ncbi:MAG TPA: HutD family protein [Rhodanobacteraceae bacterium]|nr:HutD family protein [Rhodanobacteraceae bacterium]
MTARIPIQSLPASSRRIEPWANGAGSTSLLWREPDDANWKVRISIARVEHDGPFSELPGARRLLVPLDAAMELHLQDGGIRRALRFGVLRFEGSPAPVGVLPEGPTRDFSLMLRGGARGELFARTLVDSQVLLPEAGARWLVYVNRGHARMDCAGAVLELPADDAALLEFPAHDAPRVVLEGAGELVLAKLYA